jgi:hypothetical protein
VNLVSALNAETRHEQWRRLKSDFEKARALLESEPNRTMLRVHCSRPLRVAMTPSTVIG